MRPIMNLVLALSLSGFQAVSAQTAKQSSKEPPHKQQEGTVSQPRSDEAATRLRRTLPVLPALNRGSDGLLSTFGQRATQNLFVSSTNVKDPATDTLAYTGNIPVEATEHVEIPAEQFVVTLPKFYATVPVLDAIDKKKWHFDFGVPFLAFRTDNGLDGFRSAAPAGSWTGPLAGERIVIFQSASFRFSRPVVDGVFGRNETEYQATDLNTHLDFTVSNSHRLATRLALFYQTVDRANLTALTMPEAAPDFLNRGGNLFFSHSYTAPAGAIVDSSVSFRRLLVRVLPEGNKPMVLVEQGEMLGNYFDNVRHTSSRFDWREAVRVPQVSALGTHQVSFGGGIARTAFDSTRLGNKVILRGHEEDELSGTVEFTGNPFESLSVHEFTGWVEDRWSPVRRVTLTGGVKYEWTTLSETNQVAPRLGFAVLPFNNHRTVIRGGVGVFYEILSLNAGTFSESRQRVVQFFHEGDPLTGQRALRNEVLGGGVITPHALGWNLEADQQLGEKLFLRVKAEERRGRNLLLINPSPASINVTSLVLSNGGTSRYRELEATASFRPIRESMLNFSYIRSRGVGDLNTFNTVYGMFEKLTITSNRYGQSRSDAPNRFLAWGEFEIPGKVTLAPAFELRSGFPFAFSDADNNVAPEVDFGRFPKTMSFDLGTWRDFTVNWLERPGKVRLGLRFYNLTNHFNPRDVRLDENEDESAPVIDRFLNSAGRSLRGHITFTF
ncbi:MAG TPA: hypothetical protein VFV34_18205 [Blastocatellia bacterium]|nr:hypothetical protein [Blastocatellia bacterium]